MAGFYVKCNTWAANRLTDLGKLRTQDRLGSLGHAKPLRCARFSGAPILSCKKEKNRYVKLKKCSEFQIIS